MLLIQRVSANGAEPAFPVTPAKVALPPFPANHGGADRSRKRLAHPAGAGSKSFSITARSIPSTSGVLSPSKGNGRRSPVSR